MLKLRNHNVYLFTCKSFNNCTKKLSNPEDYFQLASYEIPTNIDIRSIYQLANSHTIAVRYKKNVSQPSQALITIVSSCLKTHFQVELYTHGYMFDMSNYIHMYFSASREKNCFSAALANCNRTRNNISWTYHVSERVGKLHTNML